MLSSTKKQKKRIKTTPSHEKTTLGKGLQNMPKYHIRIKETARKRLDALQNNIVQCYCTTGK